MGRLRWALGPNVASNGVLSRFGVAPVAEVSNDMGSCFWRINTLYTPIVRYKNKAREEGAAGRVRIRSEPIGIVLGCDHCLPKLAQLLQRGGSVRKQR